MTDNKQALERAMTLAALSGFKIALGPAFLETARRRPSARNWVMGALGEMVLDKLGIFPPRYRPSLLVPHTLAGAWVARESLKEDGIDDVSAVAAAAAVAAGVAISAPLIRMAGGRILGIPDVLLAVAEDYLALYLGTRALGLSMGQVADEAREAVGEVRGRIRPALESVGVNV